MNRPVFHPEGMKNLTLYIVDGRNPRHRLSAVQADAVMLDAMQLLPASVGTHIDLLAPEQAKYMANQTERRKEKCFHGIGCECPDHVVGRVATDQQCGDGAKH